MEIPKIGQGTGHKGQNLKSFDEEVSSLAGLLLYGIENGLNFIDTAEIYCDGRSELVIGKLTKKHRTKMKIASKFSTNNHSKKNLIEACEKSLTRLETDYLDLYQIHWPNESVELEETLETMFELQKVGKVIEVGVCNFNIKQLESAKEIATNFNSRIFSAQIKYSLIDQYLYNQIHNFCDTNKIKVIAYSPLRNLLSYENERLKRFREIAFEANMSAAQLALSWVISKNNVYAIPETSKKERLQEFIEAQNFSIDYEIMKKINKVFEDIIVNMEVSKIRSRNIKRRETVRKFSRHEIELISEDFCPSIISLASELEIGNVLQPIIVQAIPYEKNYFEIIEGELRYWSFLYAFGPNSKIPVTIV